MVLMSLVNRPMAGFPCNFLGTKRRRHFRDGRAELFGCRCLANRPAKMLFLAKSAFPAVEHRVSQPIWNGIESCRTARCERRVTDAVTKAQDVKVKGCTARLFC